MNTFSIRTLFLTRYTPYPPIGGAPLRNWQNINAMRKYGSVAVVSISRENPQPQKIPGVELWHHDNITKRKLSRWDKWERQFWWLRPDGLPEIDLLYTIATARELDKILAKFQPELVIFEEIWLYRYFKLTKRHNCLTIFDNHNVETNLFEQTYGKTKLKLPRLKSIEGKFIRQADLVWACSQDDANLLQQSYKKIKDTYVIPNSIDVEQYKNIKSKQCQPPPELKDTHPNILFLGQYNYPPNAIAAKLLIEEIYPQLKQRYPNCRLLLVGRNQSKFMVQAAEKEPGIIVTGSVPDVKPYLAAANITIVPLRQGSGTRLKILEAFAAGCPVVSTNQGAKGLKAIDGEHLLIRDSIDELVAGVCQILSEPSLAEKLIDSAYELVKAEYSWSAVSHKIDRAIQDLFGEK